MKKTTYETVVLGFGNHAAIEIPDAQLAELGGSKRSPVKVTVKGYTYQSTAAVMDGRTLVVFPTKDREASGTVSGEKVTVTLELEEGYREVDVPKELYDALKTNKIADYFHDLNYSSRKEYARQVADAKTEETRTRRITKIVDELKIKPNK